MEPLHCRDPKPLGSGIYQQSFSCREKRWGEPTSNKLETPKSVHTLPAPQDGGFPLSSKCSKEGRLHVQTGIEGCILFRETLRVSLPLLWTRPSTKNFYKITQNPNFSCVA